MLNDATSDNNRSSLKYLIFNLHDTNISNFLRFLGFWDKHGYSKHVRYASSIRLEILKEEKVHQVDLSNYYIRVVYDDEEIHLPFCQGIYCKFEEMTDHISKHLITDLTEAERYCNASFWKQKMEIII